MLVTFKTRSYSDISMFGEVASGMLKMMGMSGEVPGAMVATDVPVAIMSLRESIGKLSTSSETQSESAADAGKTAPDGQQTVALDTRAKPLLELLESARRSGDGVMWEH